MEDNKVFFDESTVVDTMKETDRKCPQCGGVMDFVPETGDMGCPYCGYHEEVESAEEIKAAEELRFEDAENYAKTNPVAYVGQIISVIDSGKVNAFQIINEAGDLGSVSSSANFNMIEGYNASDIIKELADE